MIVKIIFFYNHFYKQFDNPYFKVKTISPCLLWICLMTCIFFMYFIPLSKSYWYSNKAKTYQNSSFSERLFNALVILNVAFLAIQMLLMMLMMMIIMFDPIFVVVIDTVFQILHNFNHIHMGRLFVYQVMMNLLFQ